MEAGILQAQKNEILRRLEELRSPGRVILAIDGRSCAGKTSLAAALAAEMGADVIHMDDFFLPAELRSPERYAHPGGNIHYERFMQEVLPALSRGEDFSYRRFDCAAMDYAGSRSVSGSAPVIVEGAYSLSPILGRYYTLAVFMDISPTAQLERVRRRGGESAVSAFRSRWIPLEERYIAAFGIREACSLVLSSG